MKMKFKKILYLLLFLSLIAGGSILYYRTQYASPAQACGSFECDWGDHDHDHHLGPIFDIDDYKPGDCVTRSVTIKNRNLIDSMAFVKAIKTKDKTNMSSVMTIVTAEGLNNPYGGTAGIQYATGC